MDLDYSVPEQMLTDNLLQLLFHHQHNVAAIHSMARAVVATTAILVCGKSGCNFFFEGCDALTKVNASLRDMRIVHRAPGSRTTISWQVSKEFCGSSGHAGPLCNTLMNHSPSEGGSASFPPSMFFCR